MLQQIGDVDNPIIGQSYLVPCVLVNAPPSMNGHWWPIIGAIHHDKEIGVEKRHVHLDFRFIKQDHLISDSRVIWANQVISDTELRKRKCYRLRIPFPTHEDYRQMYETRGQAAFLRRVENLLANERIDTAKMICPHRGISLRGQPIVDGCVVCPGHGACWNVLTGQLVRRVTKDEPCSSPTTR